MSPLSHDQKRIISQAARQAYQAWDGREAYEAINSDQSRSACFDAWRHVEQGKAVGIQSLCECTQAHYQRLQAHFIELGGDPAKAQRARARDADNGRRIAMHKLTTALRERELTLDYAATICRSKYKKTLDQANEKQVWSLFYDVRKQPVRAPVEQLENEDPF